MANIPENTTNPVLRPVTRLETTTKVFGGEYIENDEQQRGISNLQAIELAERDQYILSRVGEAYVPESGDIPAKAGIAGLDTTGKVPKAQLPTDTVYTEASQTLKNKTIDSKDNTIKFSPTVITATPATQPITLTNTHLLLSNNGTAIQLPSPPYDGFVLTISAATANAYTYIRYQTTGSGYSVLCLTQGHRVILTGAAGLWFLLSGTTLVTSHTTIDSGQIGWEKPNDWKKPYGIGTYHFINESNHGITDYDYPVNNASISVTWKSAVRATAQAQQWDGSQSVSSPIWTRKMFSTWQTGWSKISTDDDIATLTNKTIDANFNTLVNVVTSKNITNCITAIPQDINLTLSSGTLTLKAGSKVYVPNGAGVFETYTLQEDKTVTNTDNATQIICVQGSGSGKGSLLVRRLANSVSGAGATTAGGFAYNTTTNQIRGFNAEGSDFGVNYSFPIAIITVSGGAITSIDQVFNGMGYIGSTLFVLPGVKALSPNGRNSDGSLKNTERAYTTVKTTTLSATGTRVIGLAGDIYNLNATEWAYDEAINYNVSPSDPTSHTTACFAGIFTMTAGVISNFKPKTAFHAVNWNDVMQGSGIEHTATLETGVSGRVKWIVKNGVAYISCYELNTGSAGSKIITTGLPKNKFNVDITATITLGGTSGVLGNVYISAQSTTLVLNAMAAGAGYCSFSYPVADDWVES